MEMGIGMAMGMCWRCVEVKLKSMGGSIVLYRINWTMLGLKLESESELESESDSEVGLLAGSSNASLVAEMQRQR